MSYNEDTVRRTIKKAVQKKADYDPIFYFVGGSEMFGFASKGDESDVDVRGFHLADAEEYTKLRQPEEQIIVNQHGVTEGFENVDHIEVVSYELRKFGKLLSGLNFNVVEGVFHGDRVMDGQPLAIESLKKIVEDHLPHDMPRHYQGMAKQNYKKYLNKSADDYSPKPKKFLYVARGLLAANNVYQREEIEVDVPYLAEKACGDGMISSDQVGVVEQLVEEKKHNSGQELDSDLAEQANDTVASMLTNLDFEVDVGEKEKTELKDDIDDWMMKVRE